MQKKVVKKTMRGKVKKRKNREKKVEVEVLLNKNQASPKKINNEKN